MIMRAAVDFLLLFAVLHEVPGKEELFFTDLPRTEAGREGAVRRAEKGT